MKQVEESGMIFGPFPEEQFYHLERSSLYQNTGKQNGVCTVEFLLSRNERFLTFLEAKSSSPRPGGDRQERFQAFIHEIAAKFLHSFDLYLSAALGRHEDCADLPDSFRGLDRSAVTFQFVLVIKGHKEEWLPPIRAALEQVLRAHRRIWASKVVVLNDTMARKQALICGSGT
ncbi:hypothetical protein [Pseudoflavonifractor sp. MSJ-37]|uniref:hypothetical protein n=1 Tax=Pseudoflavonifractor sp. MSJ-37 TaxID=2841531 RepID=UPI001C11F096|nr:hypothetical protein [Pseudoflavonifractor sp. MSJ-37]MBU5436331.1 hypothetical protein [Pseudoflavonifractor sp. MSJ-37]